MHAVPKNGLDVIIGGSLIYIEPLNLSSDKIGGWHDRKIQLCCGLVQGSTTVRTPGRGVNAQKRCVNAHVFYYVVTLS